MANRHQEHLSGYLGSHRTVKQSSSSLAGPKPSSNTGPTSSTSRTRDVPVLFTSSARSRASYLSSRKQVHVKISGKATINHLPDELMLNIFSYLDAGDLLIACRVCKRWLPVAKDNALWDMIFAKYCGPQTVVSSSDVEEASERQPSRLSKNLYIKSICSSRNKKALRMLKKLSPFTGLPRDTDKALKSAGVYFQLTLIDHHQIEHTLNSSVVFMHQMAVSPRWYQLEMPRIKTIKRIQIHAVNPLFFNMKGTAIWNSPYQRSLLQSEDFDWNKCLRTTEPTGGDDMVQLYTLPAGLLIATWKGDGELAFVAAGLHCSQLMRRCLLGSPEMPFDIGTHKVVPDDIDSCYGLHDYQCTVEIRTLRNTIWSQQFNCLSCKKEHIASGFATFPLIRKDYHCDHVILQKHLQFPWKTDTFRGIIENVTWVDVTVLDERNEPFWCISSMCKVAEQGLQKNFDFDYSSEEAYMMSFMDERGKLEAQMSKTDDEKFFMTILNLQLSLDAINTWFGTNYT